MSSFGLLIILTTLLFTIGYAAAYINNDRRQNYQLRTIHYNTNIINHRYLQVSTPPADCLDLDLLADSADINKQLKEEDYYTFTDAYANGYYSANNINSYDELPIENKNAFIELACPCKSSSPSLSMVPSTSPTFQSSTQPSQLASSMSPSVMPSIEPSISIQPTLVSSSSPSESVAPSNKPSPLPSIAVSVSPSNMPSFIPTISKSLVPSTSSKPSMGDCCEGNVPFLDVSGINTSNPDSMSDELKEYLSNICSVTLDAIGDKGIKTPSFSPSITMNPSMLPSIKPSTQPSIIPSTQPSSAPTSKPTTKQPTRQPSRRPSRRPVTRRPTRAPKTPRPTRRPSSSITTIISPFPTLVPTLLPTISEPEPTETPTELPTLPLVTIINPPSPTGIINDDPTMIPTPLIELVVGTDSPIIGPIEASIEPTILVSEDTLSSSSSLEPTLLASQDTLSSEAPVKVSTDDPFSVSVTSSVYVSPTISPSKDGLASTNVTTANTTTSTDNEDTGSSLPWLNWCEKDDGSLYPCPDDEVEAGLLPWSNDTSINSNDTSVSRPVNDDDSSSNTTFGGTLEGELTFEPTPSPQEESSSSSAALETVDNGTNTEGAAGLSSGAIFGIILAVVTLPLGVVYLSHRRG